MINIYHIFHFSKSQIYKKEKTGSGTEGMYGNVRRCTEMYGGVRMSTEGASPM